MRAWWIIIFIVLFLEAGTLGVLLFLDGDVSYKNQNDKWDNVEQTIDIAQDDYAIGDVVIIGSKILENNNNYEKNEKLKKILEQIEDDMKKIVDKTIYEYVDIFYFKLFFVLYRNEYGNEIDELIFTI